MAGLDANSTADMTFDVVEGDDGTVTVSVKGELDITNIERLAVALAPALEREPARLIVDARALRFADSSAIALWVRWATAVPATELRHPPPTLRKVLASMGLAEMLNVAP
jgi:anti-anti-sigma factor